MTHDAAPTVLVAESDDRIVDALTEALREDGFQLYLAHDGSEALAIYDVVRPDLVLLDAVLPGVSGLDVCRELRRRSAVPIVLMSVNGAGPEPEVGLDLGADDFVTNPFRTREVVARSRAVLRRVEAQRHPAPTGDDVLDVGDVRLDRVSHTVVVRGEHVRLSLKQFELLALLMANAGHIVPTDIILGQIWGRGRKDQTGILNEQIRRLRVAIERDPAHPALVVSVRGQGYVYQPPDGDPGRAGTLGPRTIVRLVPVHPPDARRQIASAHTNGEAPECCDACAQNAAADRGDDPWAIARLSTGYVRLNPTQYYRGATLFIAKTCVNELHEMAGPIRLVHLAEMAQIAQVVFVAFTARRMNYEAPGDAVAHLRWWLTPRHADDPHPTGAIWQNPDFLSSYWARPGEPDQQAREVFKRALLDAVERQSLAVERWYV